MFRLMDGPDQVREKTYARRSMLGFAK